MKKHDAMHTRLGHVVFWAAQSAAAFCILYVLDAVLIYKDGTSFLPISGRYVSGEDLAAAIIVGLVLAMIFSRAGVGARSYVNKRAEKRVAETTPTENSM